MRDALRRLVAYASEQQAREERHFGSEDHARSVCLDALADASDQDDERHADFFAVGTAMMARHAPATPDAWNRLAPRLHNLARRIGLV